MAGPCAIEHTPSRVRRAPRRHSKTESAQPSRARSSHDLRNQTRLSQLTEHFMRICAGRATMGGSTSALTLQLCRGIRTALTRLRLPPGQATTWAYAVLMEDGGIAGHVRGAYLRPAPGCRAPPPLSEIPPPTLRPFSCVFHRTACHHQQWPAQERHWLQMARHTE